MFEVGMNIEAPRPTLTLNQTRERAMSNRMIHQELQQSEQFIRDVLASPETIAAFAEIRHGRPYFEEGQLLVNRARRMHQRQDDEYGDQYAATDALNDARAAAMRTYRRHLGLARVAFRDDRDAQEALDLNGRRHKALVPWLGQVFDFYDNLLQNEEMMAAMIVFGIERADLEAGRAEAQKAYEMHQRREREAREAVAATSARDEALDELAEWMSISHALARVVLADHPNRLKGLGVNA